MLPTSKLSKDKQVKTFRKDFPGKVIVVEVQWDDTCRNGHNTFSITTDIYDRSRSHDSDFVETSTGRRLYLGSCGCQHDVVKKSFPELAHLIPWHLVSADGPMHYIADTIYHAQKGNLDAARHSAVWPEASLEQLLDKDALLARLPELMERFKAIVESIGFTY